MLKFAAIDIGSNAVRLLLSRVFEDEGKQPFFKKDSLVRIPLRLGDDAFKHHVISDEKVEMLISTMTGFRYLLEAYRSLDYMACATSAMREAENGARIVAEVRQKSNLNLQIIDGKFEAEIIYANRYDEKLTGGISYLYIDVGGGSTELTLFSSGQNMASRSFNIGTVRLLENLVAEETWREMKKWIARKIVGSTLTVAVGSGGNINKIFLMARGKEGKPLSYKKLKEMDRLLNSYTYEERIRELNLRADRADVIVPASKIYLTVMKWAKIKEIYVPRIGLADGVVHILYNRYKQQQANKR